MSFGPYATMPDYDTMFAALAKAFDDQYAKERLYPLICKSLAGKEVYPEGINLALQLAIYDYSEGMPSVVMTTTNLFMPQFIEAITPAELVEATKALWQKALA